MTIRTQHIGDVAVLVEDQFVRVKNDRYKEARKNECLYGIYELTYEELNKRCLQFRIGSPNRSSSVGTLHDHSFPPIRTRDPNDLKRVVANARHRG